MDRELIHNIFSLEPTQKNVDFLKRLKEGYPSDDKILNCAIDHKIATTEILLATKDVVNRLEDLDRMFDSAISKLEEKEEGCR